MSRKKEEIKDKKKVINFHILLFLINLKPF